MEDWQKQELKRIKRSVNDEVALHTEYIANAKAAGKLAKRLVKLSDIEISPLVEAIGCEVRLDDSTNKLVHHFAKLLRVTFRKFFSTYSGVMSYTANINGVKLRICDVKDIPRCIVEPFEAIERTTKYKITCESPQPTLEVEG